MECLTIEDCRAWFWSHDHGPPHFHIQRPGEWEVRVFFLEEPPRCEPVLEITRVPGRMLRQIAELARLHRWALFEEWTEKVRPDDE